MHNSVNKKNKSVFAHCKWEMLSVGFGLWVEITFIEPAGGKQAPDNKQVFLLKLQLCCVQLPALKREMAQPEELPRGKSSVSDCLGLGLWFISQQESSLK